ncbi:Pre-mRNA-splicing factor CLF1 [Suhomyces tanzawaensis NRRL Y-17324]|uniref:Pre-mRNA-splicing factor CLF1 n=1 Tax=Suhomyces tanzawaensis NRRL Y-17324 TaxID=984487 RepID=A0A1E4SNG1_9ASCO|nr:Pre-mRNA-splicing factor CLF1 [Suhomyces tanzawaensis NRRL Y-17324]ODV81060.1 Pre-mRNA-splicing factor CLF1 [Suhomyces tanzawaensis NRRL Y-17324]
MSYESSNQLTSEQILKDAYENKDRPLERPKQSIQDLDELRSFQLAKRKEYEQQLNKNRLNFNQWLRYAKWEINHNHDYARARSIFERALDVNVQHIPFWVQYIQFELSHKNVNHARNLLDRATTTLPRINKLWFMYVQTEETLRNYSMVRSTFERWLKWQPDESVWDSYINFEKRYEEFENVRQIFRRYIYLFPNGLTWLKWIEFELYEVQTSSRQIQNIRLVFESSVDHLLGQKSSKTDLALSIIITKWSDWEISVQEFERARMIYTLLLEDPRCKGILLEDQRTKISQLFTDFEKNHGNKNTIESSVTLNRLNKYRANLKEDAQDYDSWWAYISILEQQGDIIAVREAFENAIKNLPTDKNKSLKWRRYIYLWIKYALWEEISLGQVENARNIWVNCLKSVPHKQFTFGKIWIKYAEFELRNSIEDGLPQARKVLGQSIGQSSIQGPKKKLFKYYVEFEKKLGEWLRVRKLYERWLELALANEQEFIPILEEYIEFEKSLNEHSRCVSLFELGLGLMDGESITISVSDNEIERLWISFIEYYKEEMQYSEARSLYVRLTKKTPVPKVWISYALFESSIPTEAQLKIFQESDEEEFLFEVNDEHRTNTRKVFDQAQKSFQDNKDYRLVVLEAWKSYESLHGSEESQQVVEKKMPALVQRRRKVDGVEEEYTDYIFPEDEEKKPKGAAVSKFLANAKKWAQQQA